MLIRAQLDHIAFLEATIAEATIAATIAGLDTEVARALVPFQQAMTLLQSLPGVPQLAAAGLIAAIGVDMSRFPSAKHLASWAGVCPGNRQRGGRRLSGATTHGAPWLRGLLAPIAWAAIRTKGTAIAARFPRIARRQGRQKALVAVMHHLLVVIYTMLRDRDAVPYHELGPDYYHPDDPARQRRRLVQHVEHLGFAVTLTPLEAA